MPAPHDYQYARYNRVIDLSIALQRKGFTARAHKARYAALKYFAYLFRLDEEAAA